MINGDGMTAGLFHQLHARYIRQTVTDIDHIAEEHTLFRIRTGAVQVSIIVDIQNALIDPVNELGLIGIVYGYLWPDGSAILIIKKFAGVYLLKILIY